MSDSANDSRQANPVHTCDAGHIRVQQDIPYTVHCLPATRALTVTRSGEYFAPHMATLLRT